MKPNKTTRQMTLRQRAEISASKRFDKETQHEQWESWVEFYENNFLPEQAIPAAVIGQYVRIRPSHFRTQEAVPA